MTPTPERHADPTLAARIGRGVIDFARAWRQFWQGYWQSAHSC